MMFAKASLALAAAALSLSALSAAPAAAQSVQSRDANGYYYDPCQRSTVNRTTGGGLLGAALGAVVGSSIAGKHNKTEGAVLGGVLGAAVGAKAGNTSAACTQSRTQTRTYGQTYGQTYSQPNVQTYGYGYGDDEDEYEAYEAPVYQAPARFPHHEEYGYQAGRPYSRSIAERPAGDGCTLAESPIYLPDGRIQKRFVRVCPDASGRYQVVE
jgi:hypothetical protein